MIGQIVSHYRILEKIGSGGMGEVYLAEDAKLKRQVALKFLPKAMTADPEAKLRFEREAQAAAALNHPNIVTIHEIGEHEGQVFIAMEYVEGQTLKEMISGSVGANNYSPLPIDQIVSIAAQIAAGLAAAHAKGIVHRDVKPQNILVDRDGRVKILDFGLAKLKGVSQLTKESSTLGTVHYMSPEQTLGNDVDQRSDIWSLGVVMYEMLSGKLPFNGDYEQAVIYSILNEDPASLEELSNRAPPEFCQLVERILSKEPEARPGSCDRIREMLGKVNPTRLRIEGAQREKAVVVLPFADMSPHRDQEYFCDGMAEEIINALTHIQDLRVIARTSAFSFKNKNIDVREIGEKLGVDYLLEGSVRKAEDRLRITAQLINIVDGSHIWSERYDRQLQDVFSIQEEIALKIVEKMKIGLGRQERELVAKRHTENTEAYNLYLKGRHYWNQFNEQGFTKGIEYFQRAIDLDASFALAFAGMANCHAFLAWYYFSDIAEAFTRAREAARKALRLDEQLSEAHGVLALVKMVFEKDWKDAEREFKRALELNPGHSEAHIFYSIFLAARNRSEESIREAKKGLSLDPLTLFPSLNLGVRYYYARQYRRSLQVMQDALDAHPHLAITRMYLCFPLIMMGLYDEAYQNIQVAIPKIGREQSEILALLGIIEFFRGHRSKALEILDELKKLAQSRQVSCAFVGILCVMLDKLDEAFTWFERGLEKHDHILIFLQVEPLLDKLRTDKRYLALLKKIGLRK
jgi:serine/threonine protein kinase/tetratricopeptide (TPR) repeat protein